MANTAELQALGSELRAAREQRDLSLPEVERAIKIRVKFLEALEQGNAAALPSPVQARGFLRSYARFLQLDGDDYVARWEEALSGSRRRVRRAPQPISNPRHSSQGMPIYGPALEQAPRRRTFAGLLLLLLLLGILSAATIIGAGLALSSQQRSTALSVILSPVPTELPAEPTLTPTPFVPPSPTPLPNPNLVAADSENAIQIAITARTWLRVTVDDAILYEGMPAPQTVLQYRGKRIGLRAGNAMGVRVVLNGVDLGILGARGQIVERIFP
ncbi:MAG: helix-turn-helix domain-containing protein [Chloroflexota bacterium]|nr:MAG: helix-turn-helix domain-containing protein [Chloroflexota bacterium]